VTYGFGYPPHTQQRDGKDNKNEEYIGVHLLSLAGGGGGLLSSAFRYCTVRGFRVSIVRMSVTQQFVDNDHGRICVAGTLTGI
jgi:hypothetical protein